MFAKGLVKLFYLKNRSYEDLEEKVLGFYNGSTYSSKEGINVDNRVPEQLLEIYEKCK